MRTPWKQQITAALRGALASGSSPEKLALGVAVGVTCGLFPVFGTTTLVTFLAGLAFRTNPVLVQVFNYLMYPVYFPAMVLFMIAGAGLLGNSHTEWSMAALRQAASGGWRSAFEHLGTALLHAIVVWLMFAPFAILALRWLLLPLMRRLAHQPPEPVKEN